MVLVDCRVGRDSAERRALLLAAEVQRAWVWEAHGDARLGCWK